METSSQGETNSVTKQWPGKMNSVDVLFQAKTKLVSTYRIAANEPSFLSAHLKVLDQRDKQKLNIKALDVVLFGPPTRMNRYFLLLTYFILNFWHFLFFTDTKDEWPTMFLPLCAQV